MGRLGNALPFVENAVQRCCRTCTYSTSWSHAARDGGETNVIVRHTPTCWVIYRSSEPPQELNVWGVLAKSHHNTSSSHVVHTNTTSHRFHMTSPHITSYHPHQRNIAPISHALTLILYQFHTLSRLHHAHQSHVTVISLHITSPHFLALLDYVSRAHKIAICPSSVVRRPSVRVAIISELNARISFKF